MQLTIRLLGVEMLHVELCDPEPDEGKAADCTTYPVGFTARMDIPEDIEVPDREA